MSTLISSLFPEDMPSGKKFSKDDLLTIKLYSYHYDTYINLPMRGVTYDLKVLLKHYISVKYFDEVDFTDLSYGNFTKSQCENMIHPVHYILFNKDLSYENFLFFVKCVYLTSKTIYDKIIRMGRLLPERINVYRGIKYNPVKEKVFYGFNSLTSCSFKKSVAVEFSRPRDENDNSIVFEIILPVNTSIVPINACSIIDEGEILILNSGKLVIKSSVDILHEFNYTLIQCYLDIENISDFKNMKIHPDPLDSRDIIEQYIHNYT